MVLLAEKQELLWVGPAPAPENVLLALNGAWEMLSCRSMQEIPARAHEARLVLVHMPEANPGDLRQVAALLDRIDRSPIVAIVLLPAALAEHELLRTRRGQFILADADIAPRDLSLLVEAAASLQPAISRLRADVASARSLGEDAPLGAKQIEDEMRLAARIQQDFLPRTLPRVGPIRFAALFQPASWVSGDLYDVIRLDETHLGFYIADVVGHGLPAALLTMFIKKAMQTKQIDGNSYRIIPPEEVLTRLNEDICQQDLSFCQFCTVFYGIVDVANLELQYARGGHPRPLLLGPEGSPQRLDSEGPLLGIFPDVSFERGRTQLAPGHRLVVFSDGVEESFRPTGGQAPGEVFAEEICKLRRLGPEEMVLQLTRRIEDCRAQLAQQDDVTLLVADVNP